MTADEWLADAPAAPGPEPEQAVDWIEDGPNVPRENLPEPEPADEAFGSPPAIEEAESPLPEPRGEDEREAEFGPVEPPEPIALPLRPLSAPEPGYIDRLPPSDLDAERAVLGSILIDQAAIIDALELVTPADFYRQGHALIFRAMSTLYEAGQAPDVVTVAAQLERTGDLEAAGGASYLSRLGNDTPTAVHVAQYATIVADRARERATIVAAGRIAEAAYQRDPGLAERVSEIVAGLPRATRTVAAAVPLADYIADPSPVAWALPTLAVVESVTAVVAPPESMKTFLLLQAGLACAGSGDLLGLYPDRLPFVYISNEKSRATVRERFRHMTAGALPTEPVLILHRAGVTFGRGWDVVRRTLDELARPALVALDTLASLSGPGFDENSGQDMAVALAALRGIVTDYHATVLLAHHPAKAATGTGGATLRGHSSLFGEIDGVIGMRRHDRDATTGTLTADPKDGERVVLGWDWSIETFRLRPSGLVPLTLDSIAETVARLGDDASGDEIAAAFAGQNVRTVQRRIGEAIEAGTIERIGKRGAFRYSSCRSRLSLASEWEGDEA